MSAPFCMFLLVVGTGLTFLFLSPWPIFFALCVLCLNWKFWRNQ